MSKFLKQLATYIRKNKSILILLSAIFLVAAFLRFYNFPFRYGLGDETVRDAVVGIEGARNLQLPLTGAFSSAGPFTFGPWFYYQLIFFTLVTQQFYASWIYISIASFLSVVVLYKIGSSLENKWLGIILATLGTLSPALILSGTHLTNPNLVTFFALIVVWLFILLVQKNRSYWVSLLFGIVLGITVNIHYQALGLLILILLLLIYKYKKPLYFFYSSLGVAITFLPLLFFDLNNHWYTVRNFTYYYLYGKNAIYTPNRWLFYLRDFWPSFWSDTIGVPEVISILLIIASFVVFAVLLIKRKLSPSLIMLLIVFVVNFILLRFYWGPRFFGYLNFLRPFVFLFTGYVIFALFNLKYKNKQYGIIFGLLLLITITIFATQRIKPLLYPDSFSTEMYQATNLLKNAYPGKKFSIYNCEYKGNTQYSAISHSVVFLLEMQGKFDDNGVKIGVKGNDCQFPLSKRNSKQSPETVYPNIANTLFFDLSSASNSELQEAGWKKDSFKAINDSTVRWWFKEQP